jgi:hypothetical protein
MKRRNEFYRTLETWLARPFYDEHAVIDTHNCGA